MVYVLSFESTHAAMAAQKAFAAKGVSFLLIPTPRAISAGCGMSLKFEARDDAAAQRTVCEQAGLSDETLAHAVLFAQEEAAPRERFRAVGISR